MSPARGPLAAQILEGVLRKHSARIDRLAIAVFEQAQQSGEPVTMDLVKRAGIVRLFESACGSVDVSGLCGGT